jgi:hypothetical protein
MHAIDACLDACVLNLPAAATFNPEVQERHGADIFSSQRHFRLVMQVINLQPLLRQEGARHGRLPGRTARVPRD